MTKRERELRSEGALAYARGDDLACPAYTALRSSASRVAFVAGYEEQRRRTAPVEPLAEDYDANLAALKAFARTL